LGDSVKSPLTLISKVQPGLVASGTYFVAELEGTIAGAGGWTPHRRGDVGEVRHVVTDDRHVRRGVGRALMGRVFDSARGAGVRLLSCRATRTAVPFYQALGFVTQGPIEVPMGPGISFPAIQMQKAL
jgi:GNAT superfamily N-acetyltransferase